MKKLKKSHGYVTFAISIVLVVLIPAVCFWYGRTIISEKELEYQSLRESIRKGDLLCDSIQKVMEKDSLYMEYKRKHVERNKENMKCCLGCTCGSVAE